MLAKPYLSQVLDDEALTRGLSDPEARLLVEWLVECVESLLDTATSETETTKRVRKLCRHGRALSRFVQLWCYQSSRGAAVQLAAVERFPWPLPTSSVDPYDLMQSILYWETKHREVTPSS